MKTVRVLFLLYCALLAASCSQETKHKPAPSKIDALRTSVQVEQLLRSVDTSYMHFAVDTTLRLKDKRIERRYRLAGVKAWEKADLDGNGYMDLLVTGRLDYGIFYSETSKVVCLLDMGAGKLLLEELSRQSDRYGPIAKIVYDGSQPLLRYTDFAPPVLAVDSLKYQQPYLLTYKFGGFIEYNKRPDKPLLLDSIVYDDFIISKLVLNSSGRAAYSDCQGPVLPEDGKTVCEQLNATVDAKSLAQIKAVVNYINRDSLKPQYHAFVGHVPQANLTFSYHDGRKIKVFDHGEFGTFGLTRLYALLGQLRKTQQWQPVQQPVTR